MRSIFKDNLLKSSIAREVNPEYQSIIMTDSDGWETEEETDVLVKLSGVIRDDFLKAMTSEDAKPKCTHLGLMTDEPYIQLGKDIFRGQYSHSMGTNLILEACPKQSNNNEQQLTLHSTCDKQLEMKKLYMHEKTTPSSAMPQNPSTSPTSAAAAVEETMDSTEQSTIEAL